MTAADIHRTILAVWRIEQPRLITGLSRMLRDVPLAEDLTQEALVAALEHWPVIGRAGKARGVADGDGQAPGAGSIAPPPHARSQARDADTRPGAGAADDARSGRCAGRRYRRRVAAADLHRLPSAIVARGPRRAGASDDLRPDHGRDRARLPAAGGDHRPAHRAREADAVGIRARLRNPARRGAFGTAGLGAGGRLPHLQRRLHRGPRRRVAAAAALPRRAAHGPRAHTGRAAGSRSPRPAGADGAERLAHRGAHRCRRRPHPADGPEPRALGPASDPPRLAGAGAGA